LFLGEKISLLGKEENWAAQFLSQGNTSPWGGGKLATTWVWRKKKTKAMKKKKVVSLEWSTIGGHPIVFFGRGKIEWPFGLYICVCMYVCIINFFLKKVVSFGRKKTRWPPCCVLWEGENQVVIQFSPQGNNLIKLLLILIKIF